MSDACERRCSGNMASPERPGGKLAEGGLGGCELAS